MDSQPISKASRPFLRRGDLTTGVPNDYPKHPAYACAAAVAAADTAAVAVDAAAAAADAERRNGDRRAQARLRQP